jgi:hypothetical protein
MSYVDGSSVGFQGQTAGIAPNEVVAAGGAAQAITFVPSAVTEYPIGSPFIPNIFQGFNVSASATTSALITPAVQTWFCTLTVVWSNSGGVNPVVFWIDLSGLPNFKPLPVASSMQYAFAGVTGAGSFSVASRCGRGKWVTPTIVEFTLGNGTAVNDFATIDITQTN